MSLALAKHEYPGSWRYPQARFDRAMAATTVTAELLAEGWRSAATVPNRTPVAIFQQWQIPGEFDGSGAFILEDGYWFSVDPHAPYNIPPDAILGWKRWKREGYRAIAQPSRGRRG